MSRHVLLVEDSPGDVRLTREAFQAVRSDVDIHVATDGMEAMAFLMREGDPGHADAYESLVESISEFWLTQVKLPKRPKR